MIFATIIKAQAPHMEVPQGSETNDHLIYFIDPRWTSTNQDKLTIIELLKIRTGAEDE